MPFDFGVFFCSQVSGRSHLTLIVGVQDLLLRGSYAVRVVRDSSNDDIVSIFTWMGCSFIVARLLEILSIDIVQLLMQEK